MFCALDYVRVCAFCPPHALPVARAKWLQRSARRFLRLFNLNVEVKGRIPGAGLLVSNHLSYVDILVLASLAPCAFVSKSEVKNWPIFGWFARLGGTIFVDRNRPTHAGQSVDKIGATLDGGALLVLFAEGTSSGGETVLPFKSSLLEPATRRQHALTVAHISYQLADGIVSEEVCYWKDMTLFPHLLNLLGKRSIHGVVGLMDVRQASTDRKELARQLHEEVLRLREAIAA